MCAATAVNKLMASTANVDLNASPPFSLSSRAWCAVMGPCFISWKVINKGIKSSAHATAARVSAEKVLRVTYL